MNYLFAALFFAFVVLGAANVATVFYCKGAAVTPFLTTVCLQ